MRHLSRLMATQFTAMGIGPGVEQTKNKKPEQSMKPENTPATVYVWILLFL